MPPSASPLWNLRAYRWAAFVFWAIPVVVCAASLIVGEWSVAAISGLFVLTFGLHCKLAWTATRQLERWKRRQGYGGEWRDLQREGYPDWLVERERKRWIQRRHRK